MKRLLLAAILFLLPTAARAATVDLGISAKSISFSDDLIAGTTVRIYAEVTNHGDTDVEGYVSFFQGSLPVDDSQVISVRADGAPEEVYVDFVVPSGEFNIRAEIKGTDPADQDSSNDVAITTLFTPVLDDDRDGVENASDNCPETANATQSDADADGSGDACDDDDDDDGLTDEVEEELGTNEARSDTDGDGVDDPNDAYPTDATKTKVEPVVVPAVAAAPAVVTQTPGTSTATPAVALSQDVPSGEAAEERTEETGEEPAAGAETPEDTSSDLTFSPKAIFSYERDSWNTFAFTALTPETDGYQYQWDFGDGVTSSRSEVRHTYTASGEYVVTFRVTDPSGSVSEDTATVHVRFWTLQNRVVEIVLAFLTLLLLVGVGMVARLSRRARPRISSREGSEKPTESDSGVAEEDKALDKRPGKKLTVRNLDDEE